VPRRRVPINIAPGGVVLTLEAVGDGIGVNWDTSLSSKILSHFI
jgi:hypothetical protein